MIRCLLIQITRNKRGQPIREERLITGEDLRIGRGTDANVYLPDPRLRLLHAVIRTSADGKLHIDGEGALLNINGTLAESSKLRYGARIMVGPYEVNVEAPNLESKLGEHDFILTTELVQPLASESAESVAHVKTSLAASGLSKRKLALALATIVGALFLILPMLAATTPAWRTATVRGWMSADESWNPGTLSAAHQSFGRQCNECHKQPFQHVPDSACQSCHKTIGGHVEAKALQRAAFGTLRCAECHRDHKGSNGLLRSDSALCVDCHGNLKAKAVDTKLADIHDFATDHPPFKLALKTGPGKFEQVEQTNSARVVEKSGLKFPHDVHLARNGVKAPNGRRVMECRNCHEPDEGGVRFKPVSMQKHCIECHRLEFEPAVTTRQVPHGSARQVVMMLRDFYAGVALGQTTIDIVTENGFLRRPGQSRVDSKHAKAADWAKAKADRIATELFEVRVCIVCHHVDRSPNDVETPWKIVPVNQTDHWITKARFEHFRHDAYGCATCHDVKHSRSASNVAIPDIKTCQTCHSGAKPARDKIVSNCESCHGFHLGDHRSGGARDAAMMLTPPSSSAMPIRQ